jgi:IS5 family transposase
VDRRHKLVRRYRVTDATVHDSQVVDDILDTDNTAADVWGDSAYWSAAIVATLKAKGLKSRLHRKGQRAKPLSEREKQGNRTRSKVRARVEHVFGAQSNDMGGTLVRSIGLVGATARIGLKNLHAPAGAPGPPDGGTGMRRVRDDADGIQRPTGPAAT